VAGPAPNGDKTPRVALLSSKNGDENDVARIELALADDKSPDLINLVTELDDF